MPEKKLTKRQAAKNIKDSKNRYALKNVKSITFRMMVDGDADIIAYIDSLPNKADWFRSIVRNEIGLRK